MKKTLLTSVAALFLATGTAHASSGCAMVATEPYGEGPSDSLNLRLKPNIRSKVLEKLEHGTTLVFNDDATLGFKNWIYIEGSVTEEGYERRNPRGWVFKKYILETECPTGVNYEGPTSAPPQD